MILVTGEVTFQDKVGVFWLKAVMEFDDNVDMKLDRAEFCQLYKSVTSQAADALLCNKIAGNANKAKKVCAAWQHTYCNDWKPIIQALLY